MRTQPATCATSTCEKIPWKPSKLWSVGSETERPRGPSATDSSRPYHAPVTEVKASSQAVVAPSDCGPAASTQPVQISCMRLDPRRRKRFLKRSALKAAGQEGVKPEGHCVRMSGSATPPAATTEGRLPRKPLLTGPWRTRGRNCR